MCYVHLMNVLEHAIPGSYAQYLIPIMMVRVMLGSNSNIAEARGRGSLVSKTCRQDGLSDRPRPTTWATNDHI